MKLPLTSAALAALLTSPLFAVDHHVTTPQEFQNALTTAAANGADDTVFLAAGFYQGNFNFLSAEAFSLTIQAEAGIAADQVVLDGAGVGGSLNLNCSGLANLWLGGITIKRNTGNGNGSAGTTDGFALSVATLGDVQIEHSILPCDANQLGGGIAVSKANNITISNSSVTYAGTGSSGGGIWLGGFSGAVLVDSCMVTGNYSFFTGAGLLVQGGGTPLKSVNIRNSTISYNISNTSSHYPDGPDSQGAGGGGIGFTGSCATTITGNTFQGNSSRRYGGAIYSRSSTNTITGNRFLGNHGSGTWSYPFFGGAVLVIAGTVENNEFDGNRAYGVCGALCITQSGTVRNNVFRNNACESGNGGALHVGAFYDPSSTACAIIENNLFEDNKATNPGGTAYSGGAAYLNGASFVLRNNTFLRNTATGSAGGVYLPTTRPTGSIVTNNLFAQNTSGDSGGGMLVKLDSADAANIASLDLINNTFTGNTATNLGGGLRIEVVDNNEILNVYNNIIWGNSAHDGDDIYLSGFGASKKLMNNIVHDVAGVFELALNNIDAAPVFFNPTSDDYHVRLGSLNIDAGDPAAPNLPSTDRDGQPRVAGLRVDMGCYEFDNTGGHPADLNDDFVISQAEYDNYAAAWKNDLGWSRGPQPIDADYVTRAGFILTNGGTYHNDGGSIPTNWKPGTGN